MSCLVSALPEPQNHREVSDISLSVKPKGNRSNRGRRVGLRECIVPGVWNDVNDWITKSLSDGTSQAPAIVPFAFPKMATEVMAARRSELKWVRSPGHGKEIMLTLCDIRIRRFRERSIIRAVGRGTCSAISRESFGSDARVHDDEEKQLTRFVAYNQLSEALLHIRQRIAPAPYLDRGAAGSKKLRAAVSPRPLSNINLDALLRISSFGQAVSPKIKKCWLPNLAMLP
ncbi:hypothetical protein AK812_SmicGene41723 [Symbiodinium microadriaticum]|uniref:Uncharacterized protein n=1 Tax=Symbiodinium microadriaticum TaxID=2951 RepID=A0A1Q9C5F1_SYMMI|nr:hypothetical protein AK812_SmicGene41723 [Symbiodinium microadriaticum]